MQACSMTAYCEQQGNSKSQITNTKQITMTEIQNSKPVDGFMLRTVMDTYYQCFGHYLLEFGACYLGFSDS